MRQTEIAIEELGKLRPEWDFEIIPMSTTGDNRLSWSLETTGGKGLFTSALEEAMVREEADLAVHSSKDLPTEMAEGVTLAGYLKRAPAGDLVVMRDSVDTPSLIATSSPRRRAQLKKLFPKAAWKEIRGNVQTRLTKIQEGFADATVMAQAGLYRMGITEWPGLKFENLSLDDSVPAAGQGAIGLQVRTGDVHLYRDLLCSVTAKAVDLERAWLAAMGGGCHSATAAHFDGECLRVFDEEKGFRKISMPADRDWLDPETIRELMEDS